MQTDYTNNTEELLLIFSDDTYGIDKDRLVTDIEKTVRYYSLHHRHQYHVVTKYLNLKSSEGEDVANYILHNIDNMLKELQNHKEEYASTLDSFGLSFDKFIVNLEKLYDHIALEEERILSNENLVNSRTARIEYDVVERFNSIGNDFQRKVDETSNSLNANIITVVGLFSAIIFVFFGGVTSLSEMLNGIWKIKSAKELTYPLIALLVAGFIIFNVIFLLLYIISKIVDKNIGSSVRGNITRWYYVEEVDPEIYGIFWDGTQFGKSYSDKWRAERRAKIKVSLSKLKNFCFQFINRIFFRFPYVTIINGLFILSIIYLYCFAPK